MRKTHEGAHFHQNGRHTACSFTENEPPTGIPQVYLKRMTILKKNGKTPNGWFQTHHLQ